MTSRRLIVQTGDSTRELLFIGRLTVGRASECDISLNDGKVSRRHAELDATGAVPRITDLGSRNGLLVNNRKVSSAELQPGDVIVIGDARIVVDLVDETVAAPGFDGLATAGEDRTAVIEVRGAPGLDGRAGASPTPPAPAPLAVPPVPSAVPPMPSAAVPPPAAPVSPSGPPALPSSGPPVLRSSSPPVSRSSPAAAPVVREDLPPVAAPAARDDLPPIAPARSALHLSSDDDERTAVLPRPVSPSQVTPVLPSADDDERTAVIPREAMPPRRPLAPPPPAPMPVAAPAPVAQAPPSLAPPPPVAPAPGALDAPSAPAPLPTPAPGAPPATTGPVAGPALRAPRFSWGGMLMLLCIGLGALATLMAAIPLLSSSTGAIDALSTRQARTLVNWLADAAGRDAAPTTADAALATVLSQDNVVDGMVLDAQTGQIVAPVRQAGRTIAVVPGAGDGWRGLREIRVDATGEFVDALLPFTRGGGAHLAWVRYEKPATGDQSLALMVALVGTMVLAFVASLLIRRHTAASLGLFTRQVELAVSGADPRVMQGTLVPGLERLPGIVAYLLEQRKAGAPVVGGGSARPSVAEAPAAAVDEAAWIIVTPSLSVTETSPHAPSTGIRNWASGARGQHLLDVLEPGALCNAVVQGLGALSNAPGAEMTVPVSGRAPVSLRREAGGHVRIALPMR